MHAGASLHLPEGGPSSSAAAAAAAAAAAVGSAEERVKRWRTRAEAQLLALDMVRRVLCVTRLQLLAFTLKLGQQSAYRNCSNMGRAWQQLGQLGCASSPAAPTCRAVRLAISAACRTPPALPTAGRHALEQQQPSAAILCGSHPCGARSRRHCVPGDRQGPACRHSGHGGCGAGWGGPGGLHLGPWHLPARCEAQVV